MKLNRKAALLFLICFGFYISLSLLVEALLPENSSMILQLLFYAFGVSIPAFLLPAIFFRSKHDYPPYRIKHAPPVFIAIALGVGCMFLNLSLLSLYNGIFYYVEINSAALDVKSALGSSNILIMLLTVVLIPAVSEEYLMRGALLETWRRTSPVVAAVLTSLLFALLHIAPSYLFIYFAIGMLLAIVYNITRNVWLTVVIHLINNLISVISAAIYYGNDGGASAEAAADALTRSDYFTSFVSAGMFAAAIIIPMVFVLRGYCKRHSIGAYAPEDSIAYTDGSSLLDDHGDKHCTSDILLRPNSALEQPDPDGKRSLFREPLVWVSLILLVAFNILSGLIEFGVISID